MTPIDKSSLREIIDYAKKYKKEIAWNRNRYSWQSYYAMSKFSQWSSRFA